MFQFEKILGKKDVLIAVDYFVHNTSEITKHCTRLSSYSLREQHKITWVFIHLIQNHPYLLEPELDNLFKLLIESKDEIVKRNLLRIFNESKPSKKHQEELCYYCLEIIEKNDAHVGTLVFAMTNVWHIANTQKDKGALNLLRIILEDKIPYQSAAYKARGKMILKKIPR